MDRNSSYFDKKFISNIDLMSTFQVAHLLDRSISSTELESKYKLCHATWLRY